MTSSLPGQYFADAAMTDAQTAGDFTRTHAALRQLHDALPHRVRQRAPVNEDAAELVHPVVPCRAPGKIREKISKKKKINSHYFLPAEWKQTNQQRIKLHTFIKNFVTYCA